MFNYIKSILKSFYQNVSSEKFFIGSSLARIGIGSVILYNYLILYFQKQSILGPGGILGNNPSNFSIYSLTYDPIIFELLYNLGIIFSILFIIGYKGRVISIINYIFTISFINQGYLLSDGGDNLVSLLLFYLIFADTTRYFSIDNKLKKNKKSNDLTNILHNFAIYACIIQICIVYVISALYQLQGNKWTNGTALYYVTQVDLFSNPNLTWFLHQSDVVMTLLTYFSIIIKIAFPFLIFISNTKIFIVIFIILFNFGFGFFMCLVTIDLSMLF
ncbi:HTTM domain-containing protein, partial [Staphylococcus gallinarum]|uniref:HTTM domain-containing protein n=1 Tax=Staphylococcus gallinarum TaxID=1293 RepID=UPI0015FA6B79